MYVCMYVCMCVCVCVCMYSITARIIVEEENRRAQYGSKHSVVEDPGGIDADQIEQCSPQQVQTNTGDNQHCVGDQSVRCGQRTGQGV